MAFCSAADPDGTLNTADGRSAANGAAPDIADGGAAAIGAAPCVPDRPGMARAGGEMLPMVTAPTAARAAMGSPRMVRSLFVAGGPTT
ncbi:hypothetical protein GCM10023196_073600 [Actinoallomurus vinaceus]|uniref:Uncharacterized protein n=1 Tax=Actinoallomurus vinaceus TaxID=1080074 RepID=A0ABP8UKY8_9ACTN